jgi:hypothetical protein
MATPQDARKTPRKRGRLLGLLAALLLGPFLAEGILRWLLFAQGGLAQTLGAPFRRAELYVAAPQSDDFAKLSVLLGAASLRERPLGQGHAEIGWLRAVIDGTSYRHADEPKLAGRRPVLLYGSSFASCKWPNEPCFEELLDGSPLGREFGLLNYAVQGHGLDQTLLLLRRSLDLYASQSPVVALAFVVEADLDRVTLSFFSRPKPRFRREGEGFVLEPPDELDVGAFLARHPPSVRSYFWRYLAGRLPWWPVETRQGWEDEPARREEREALVEYLLGAIGAECRTRALEHFVLLFHAKRAYPAPPGPEELGLRSTLDRLGLPWVDTRVDVAAAQAAGGPTLEQLFDPWDGHPTARGTEVLAAALERGLRGERDGEKGR